MICWLCNKETGIKEDAYGDHRCPWCNVEISIYNPADYQPESEEEMAKVNPESYRIPFMDYETDIDEEGMIVIEDEAAPAGEYGHYTCTVSLASGMKRKVSFNRTSLSNIVSAWGDDTTLWIGKKLKFSLETIINPKTKLEIPNSRVWHPVQE